MNNDTQSLPSWQGKAERVAWVEEIPFVEPLNILAMLGDVETVSFLDCASPEQDQSAWSYIMAEPFAVLSAHNNQVLFDGKRLGSSALISLQDILENYPLGPARIEEGLPPFQGGVCGYFAYELAGEIEKLPRPRTASHALPDMMVGFFDAGLAFDIKNRRAFVFSTGHPMPAGAKSEKRAQEQARIWQLRAQAAQNIVMAPGLNQIAPIKLWSNFTRQSYEAAVRRVIDYIYAGDIFQANIAQCFSGELPPALTSFDLYRRLRQISPAPFAAYLRFADKAIVSSSPEQFIELTTSGAVITRPIKGTRPRGPTKAEDAALAAALMASEKDRAENVMIVDLMRNDLSRVCADFSVQVDALCALKSYAQVHHLVSTVSGQLRKGLKPLDLLRAVFPGGSITGAPKLRAMEIIAEIETLERGPYCGAIGYIGFDGAMSLNIAIRTIILDGQALSFHVGGGIVAQSNAEDEYAETLAKAQGLMRALNAGG